jgi:hypothetical protein
MVSALNEQLKPGLGLVRAPSNDSKEERTLNRAWLEYKLLANIDAREEALWKGWWPKGLQLWSLLLHNNRAYGSLGRVVVLL